MIGIYMLHAHVHVSVHDCGRHSQTPVYTVGDHCDHTWYAHEGNCSARKSDESMHGASAHMNMQVADACQQKTIDASGGRSGRYARRIREGKQEASDEVLDVQDGHAGFPAAIIAANGSSNKSEGKAQKGKTGKAVGSRPAGPRPAAP